MPKTTVIQNAFNAGEFSPLLDGRTDVAYYAQALYKAENFVPTVQGPLRRRPGTRYVSAVKNSAHRTWLLDFQFSAAQAYILEFGDYYVRFYTNRGQVTSMGSPLSVSTPYPIADLTTSDGQCALRTVQSGDVLYIAHANYPVQKLVRSGATTWSCTALAQDGGPFEDVDPDQTIKMSASANTGSVTITASSATFASTDVGRLIYLENAATNTINLWTASTSITTNDLRRSDGKTYKAASTATTGANQPKHIYGTENDGNPGVAWEYQDPGFGWAKITAYTDSTHVTASVLSLLPYEAVGAKTTTRWALGEWCSENGYPDMVTFFRERLVFARSSDQKVWFSVVGDYENFRRKDENGQVTDDMAISLEVTSDQVNKLQWILPMDKLLVGTLGGEHYISEVTMNEVFGPKNVTVKKFSDSGSRGVQPVKVGKETIFVHRNGRRMLGASYKWESDGYDVRDLQVFAPHLAGAGQSFTSTAFTSDPQPLVWVVRNDGQLLSLTVSVGQDVTGWSRHVIGGAGIVECVRAIPSPNADRDDLWMIVRRTINGSTVRYVEYVTDDFEANSDSTTACFVDSSLTYSGAATTTITGLDHLEGQTVDLLVNGATHPSRTVSGGAVTLARSATTVVAGLSCPAKVATMRIEAGQPDGTAQSRRKRILHVTLRFAYSLGGKAGWKETVTDTLSFRTTADPMGEPPEIYTGDKTITWNGSYDNDGRMWYINDQPLPVTLVAFIPEVVTE